MIAVDTNLLVYAHRAESSWHAPAKRLLRELAERSVPWAIPWPCLHEFLAVVTNTRIFRPPTPLAAAIGQVASWLESPTLVLLAEGGEHWDRLTGLLQNGKAIGGSVHDARIAAICLSHGVRELWTADRDFARFPKLKTRNPLVEP